MDHIRDYVYDNLMRYLSLSETLLSKEALEKLMAQARRTIKHYQSENGRFSDNSFAVAIDQKYQKINFFGVGAHHQNGIVENKNKILITNAMTPLLHGMRMWPENDRLHFLDVLYEVHC